MGKVGLISPQAISPSSFISKSAISLLKPLRAETVTHTFQEMEKNAVFKILEHHIVKV